MPHGLMRAPGAFVIALAALGTVWVSEAAWAQANFRSGIDLVRFGVTVVDRRGELVTDLRPEDFVILEEGKLQKLEYFSRGLAGAEVLPDLHAGLLFDTSESMSEDLSFSRSAAIKFLQLLPEAEDITLVDFDTEVRVAHFPQTEFPRLVERLRGRKPKGWTALYDALGVYLDGAESQDGRKVLVIYTDGGDTRSSTSFRAATELMKASDVTVYAVGFLEHQSPSFKHEQRSRLQQLVQITGGEVFFPTSIKQLDATYEKVLKEIRAQYTLGYVPIDALNDGRWRNVEIRVSRPNLKGVRVRTRKGYYALKKLPAEQP